MRKIIMSVLAIVLAVGTVSGAAYALFSDTARVSGITIKSGSAVLQVRNSQSAGWTDATTFNNSVWTGMLYPGFTNPTPIRFWLKNASTADIGLKLTGKILDGATGDWDALKDVVAIRFNNVFANPPVPATPWKTLNEWYAGGIALPQFLVPVGDDDEFTMEVKMLDGADDDAAGKLLQNITFEFTGTQIVP